MVVIELSPVAPRKSFHTHKYKFPLKLATTIIPQLSKCIQLKMRSDSVYMQFLIKINYTRIDPRCTSIDHIDELLYNCTAWSQFQLNENHTISFDELVSHEFIIGKWNVYSKYFHQLCAALSHVLAYAMCELLLLHTSIQYRATHIPSNMNARITAHFLTRDEKLWCSKVFAVFSQKATDKQTQTNNKYSSTQFSFNAT